MTRPAACLVLLIAALAAAAPARAQQPAPRIGPFAIDLHGALPQFPTDQALADSRGVTQAALPGLGLGLHVGAHVYPLRWRAVTFGIGGELLLARAHGTPPVPPGGTPAPSLTERFTSYSPQISLNFGGVNGWSFLSAGLGTSVWSLIPDGGSALPADSEKLKTISYGGGGRWFAGRRVGFSFDVRFYAVNPGTPGALLPASPRATMLVITAGVSVR